MPAEWVTRMRRTAVGELDRERKTELAYDELRTRTLEEAARRDLGLMKRGEKVFIIKDLASPPQP